MPVANMGLALVIGGRSGILFGNRSASPRGVVCFSSAFFQGNRIEVMNSRSFIVGFAAVLAGAGVFINYHLTRKHTAPLDTPSWFESVCNPSDTPTFNCDEALKSRWAYFSLSDWSFKLPSDQTKKERLVPVSLLGMFYFTLFFLWYLAIGECSYNRRAWHILPTLVVLCGAAGSAYFVYIMFTELDAKCPWCIAAHGINAILLICTLALWPRRPKREPVFVADPKQNQVQTAADPMATGLPNTGGIPLNPPMPGTVASPLRTPVGDDPLPRTATDATGGAGRDAGDSAFDPHPTGRLVLVTFLCAMSMLYAETLLYAHQQDLQVRTMFKEEIARIQGDTDSQLLQHFGHMPKNITIRPDDPSRGGGQGWTLVTFSDFQCPACRRAAQKAAREVETGFAGRIRLVWKHYPLSTKCNPNASRDLHPDACQAAYASEAARIQAGQEGFWKFHDLLFANQARIPSLDYRQVAAQLGLDPDQFIADMESSAVKNRVREDINLGKSLDIKSTPGMFLGGRPLPSYMFYNPSFMDAVKKMVDQSVRQRANRHTGND